MCSKGSTVNFARLYLNEILLPYIIVVSRFRTSLNCCIYINLVVSMPHCMYFICYVVECILTLRGSIHGLILKTMGLKRWQKLSEQRKRKSLL